MTNTQSWYIVKQSDGHCDIIPSDRTTQEQNSELQERWGPFTTQEEAFARRIGLIRAGKCQPV